MRLRTFLSILAAVAVVVAASYLTQQNTELFAERFQLSDERSVPTWVAILGAFLAGLVPAGLLLLVQTLRRDLHERRARRLERQRESHRGDFRRAVDLQADGQWSAAAEEFERLIDERPEEFGPLVRYGEVLRLQGRPEAALEVHQRASVLFPQSTTVLEQIAEDHEALGQSGVARQVRDRVLREFPDRSLRVLRARRAEAIAEADWREATRLQDRIDALVDGAPGEQERARERSVRLGLTYQRALERMSEGRAGRAKEILRQLLDEEPDFLPAAILLGDAERLAGSDAEAIRQWQAAYARLGDPVLLQRIEDHFIERAQPREAIETLHQLIGGAENDLLPRFFLGRLYYRLEMHDEALQVLPDLAERIEKSPSYHFLLARIHHRRDRFERAAESYLACIRELGIGADYRCRVCAARATSWADRCAECGAWNAVELDFKEEKISAEELGVHRGPVWSIRETASNERDPDVEA